MQGGQVVAYESKNLNIIKQNYPTRENKLLTIVHDLNMAYYLLGRSSQIETKHENLKVLSTQPILSEKQYKWVEFLQQNIFEIH
jgi:hypothetical protein